jgi:hypothetical protein
MKKKIKSSVLATVLFLFLQGLANGESFGDVVVYANNSTTLIGQVTIEGEVAESGDVVAIYVGSELRAKQEVIIFGGEAWVNALVNVAGGNETISFKVYDASTGVTHEKSNTSAVVTSGGTVGSFASPLMIEMKDPVVDTTAPVITVASGKDTVEQGSTWTDAGATADGDEAVTVSGTVDTSAVGTYTITYTATDAKGNTGTAIRTVNVVDTIAKLEAQLAAVEAERDARPTAEQLAAVVAERDGRFIDSDKDGITDVKEAELETDSAEETVFYLKGAYDSAVAASRVAGRGDVTADPPTFALTTLAAYNGMVVQKDITITTLNTTVGEKNALIVQKDNQYNELEEQRVAEAQQLNGMIEIRNNTISSNTATIGSLNETIAQKDTAYATVVAERDARPTQESYDALIAECNARPTPEDIAALEAQLATEIEQKNAVNTFLVALYTDFRAARDERDALRTEKATFTETLETKDSTIAALSLRPTQASFDAVKADRDARPTIEEVKDARLGSVVLQSDVANQSVKIRFSVEETDDFRTWTKRDEINEITVPLEVGKRFYRFALEDE